MSFFSNLLNDIANDGNAAASLSTTQQQKHSRQPKTPGKLVFAQASPYYCIAYDHDIRLEDVGQDPNGIECTPPAYEHGPRNECQFGLLISRSVHANMLRGKLDAMLIDKKMLEQEWADATTARDEAQDELTEHVRFHARFLINHGGRHSESAMNRWTDHREVLTRFVRAAQGKMPKAKLQVKARRLRVDGVDL